MDMARFGGRTSSLLIVKNGRIAHERYWGGHDLHTAQPTFPVANSMAVTLIGHAVEQGRTDVTTPALIAVWQPPGHPRAQPPTTPLIPTDTGPTTTPDAPPTPPT